MRFHRKYRWRQEKDHKSMHRIMPLLILAVALICIVQTINLNKKIVQNTIFQNFSRNMGYQAVKSYLPILTFDTSQAGSKTIYEYLAEGVEELLPIYRYARAQDGTGLAGSSGYAGLLVGEDSCGTVDTWTEAMVLKENANMQEEMDLQGVQDVQQSANQVETEESSTASAGKKYSREKLNDFDYLIQNFYRVDSTTTTNSTQLNAAEMLKKDMTVDKQTEGPQILIYHTHSQEAYADSQDSSESVLGLGEYLAQVLEKTYGYRVLHHTGVYDLPDRDSAYSRAAPALEQLLKENPSIQVVIDLHRDGVPETTRLVETINGKETATIMFFNGLSHTTAQGDIKYLYNPNLADNLAFSFQMQLMAAEKYPGLSKCIYLKGYRYNLHYLPKSLLVEVGAQTNTYQEALNAMDPLADVLDQVLSGKVE